MPPTTPSWVRGTGTTIEPVNPTFVGSPSVKRRQINQSPPILPTDQEPTKFRSTPTTPFQPGFYKKPPLEDTNVNPFPLSPKAARRMRSEKSTKLTRRKIREAQRMEGLALESGEMSDSDMSDAEMYHTPNSGE